MSRTKAWLIGWLLPGVLGVLAGWFIFEILYTVFLNLVGMEKVGVGFLGLILTSVSFLGIACLCQGFVAAWDDDARVEKLAQDKHDAWVEQQWKDHMND